MSISDYAIKLATPARWLLILGIIATVADTARNIVYPPAGVASLSIQNQPASKKPTTAAVDIDALTKLHLFGEPMKEAKVRPESVTNAKATRLPLELKAVFAASDNEYSAAIIGQRGQRARLYAVGDTLPGNAALAEVYAEQVLLRRAGKLESLAFPKSAFTAASVDVAQPIAKPPAPSDSSSQPKPNTKPVTTAKEIARQLTNNREKTAASAGLSVNANGGYTVSNLASAPYLQNAGLKAGDVILAINGRSMSDVQSNQAMIEELMVGGKARVELMRNNTRLTITVSIPNQR